MDRIFKNHQLSLYFKLIIHIISGIFLNRFFEHMVNGSTAFVQAHSVDNMAIVDIAQAHAIIADRIMPQIDRILEKNPKAAELASQLIVY